MTSIAAPAMHFSHHVELLPANEELLRLLAERAVD